MRTNETLAIAALNDQAGRVLVVRRRDTGFFTQPGTAIAPDDDPLDALRAALWRDVGIALPRHAFAPSECPPSWKPSDPMRLVPTLGFAAAVRMPEVTPGEGIAEAVWVNPFDPHVGPLSPLTEDVILPRVADAMVGWMGG